MSLGASSARVREVRFAEQWRGYRTDEVDEFVEQVAEAFDQMEARLQESSDRAAQAERRLLDGGHEQDLSRTLILAQRTADAARQEAEADAARLVADAEEQARLLVAEAEARRSRLDEEVEARLASELDDLSERKSSLEREAASLSSFVEHERRQLADELRRQLAWLEQPGTLEPLTPSTAPGAFTAALGDLGGVAVDVTDVAPELTQWQELVAYNEAGQLDEPMPDDEVTFQDPGPLDESDDAISGEDASGDVASGEDASGDDTVLDDLDPPWRTPEHADQHGAESDVDVDVTPGTPDAALPEQPTVDDDPFLAELRRAVDDPEPLGPRDDGPDAGEWGDPEDLYGGAKTSPRFRRRRQR